MSIGRKHLWRWRAAGSEWKILDILVQRHRNGTAALRLMRKLLEKQSYAPEVLVPFD